MKGISELGRTIILGLALTCVICFILYDIGFNNSAWCNMTLDRFINFITSFAEKMNQWGTELFGEYQYQILR